MSPATAAKAQIAAQSLTADDTLQRKQRHESVVWGGRLVATARKSEAVDTIFTLCGSHVIDIYDGCIDADIRVIDVRHEPVAAHAADGYARHRRKLGCVVTTAGSGCTNAVTGIANTFRPESPILHIGGQGASTRQSPIKPSARIPGVTRPPRFGEHTEEILRTVLRSDAGRVAEVHASGAPGAALLKAAE
jgi:acetolactate synthase I/II/III large subunit